MTEHHKKGTEEKEKSEDADIEKTAETEEDLDEIVEEETEEFKDTKAEEEEELDKEVKGEAEPEITGIDVDEQKEESAEIQAEIPKPRDIEINVTNIQGIKDELKKIEDFKPKILQIEEAKDQLNKVKVFPKGKIYVIGHRGASGYEPENTLRSINRAIELGVDAVEIDVHLSKDGEPMIIHDDTLERTTNGFGRVDQTNYRGLKNLDAGKGEKIPTLQEVINICRDKCKVIIELKGEKTDKAVAHCIRRNHFYNDCYVISFWHNMVKRIKKIDPKINTGVLIVGHPTRAYRLAKDANADLLMMNYKFVSKKLVEQAQENRMDVFVWNIDKKEELKDIVDMGVNGICSNKPDVVIGYLKELIEQ